MLYLENLHRWLPLPQSTNAVSYFSFICYLWAGMLFPAITFEGKVLKWLYHGTNDLVPFGEEPAQQE